MKTLKEWLIEAVNEYKDEQNFKVKMAQITLGLIDEAGNIHYINSKYIGHENMNERVTRKI